jgi:hypothetical protein
MVTVGYAVGLVVSGWPRYWATNLIESRRHRFPDRLGRFLKRAHTAGLLRRSGVAFQFRHWGFQTWLERQDGRPDVSPAVSRQDRVVGRVR